MFRFGILHWNEIMYDDLGNLGSQQCMYNTFRHTFFWWCPGTILFSCCGRSHSQLVSGEECLVVV